MIVLYGDRGWGVLVDFLAPAVITRWPACHWPLRKPVGGGTPFPGAVATFWRSPQPWHARGHSPASRRVARIDTAVAAGGDTMPSTARSNLTSDAFCRDEVMSYDDRTIWDQNEKQARAFNWGGWDRSRTSKSEDPASCTRRFGAVVAGRDDAAIYLGASWTWHRFSGRSFPTGPEPQWHAYLCLGGPEVPFRGSARLPAVSGGLEQDSDGAWGRRRRGITCPQQCGPGTHRRRRDLQRRRSLPERERQDRARGIRQTRWRTGQSA